MPLFSLHSPQKEAYNAPMSILFLEYPKCSTCQKARKWLETNRTKFSSRHIVEQAPTIDELKEWHKRSGLPLRRFFNSSGLKYRALHLSEKLPSMTEEEMYALLAEDGMLVKRPLLITPQTAIPGFKEEAWVAALS